jgi:hypothetical protein
MKLIIKNQYDEQIARVNGFRQGKKAIEEYFQGGIEESEKKLAKRMQVSGSCWASCRMDTAIRCWIERA